MEKICAVIPAYNEAARVGAVVSGATHHVDTVLVVDDGSSDETASAAERAGAVVVRHEINKGKGQALVTGMTWALDHGFDGAVTLDADGQHDPVEIPALAKTFRDGADIVVGTRMADRSRMPLVRSLTNLVTSIVISCIAGRRITDSQSGYRLIRCATAGRLRLGASRFDTESEVLVKAARAGLVVREVPIRTIYGDEKSKINPFADTCRFVILALKLIFVER